jgi:hypothetical protein
MLHWNLSHCRTRPLAWRDLTNHTYRRQKCKTLTPQGTHVPEAHDLSVRRLPLLASTGCPADHLT